MSDQEAGRALDARVAEQVMGWVWLRAVQPQLLPISRWLAPPSDVGNPRWEAASADLPVEEPWWLDDPDSPSVGGLSMVRVPRYSTDIAVAWRVVEKMAALTRFPKGCADLCIKVGISDDGAFCEIFEKSTGYVGQDWTFEYLSVDAPTAALAICLAALAAMQATTPPSGRADEKGEA